LRITCHTIADFVCHLGKSEVYGKTIYVDRNERHEGFDGVKVEVSFQASAVLLLPGGGECLLQTGEVCGVDIRDASPDYSGSDRASELREFVQSFCERNGLVVMPGIVDE